MRAVIKEGGKKAQDLAGLADMGSLFQLANLVEPEGDLELASKALDAMNVKVDPAAEERKGGADKVAKIILSANDAKFCCIVDVPEYLTKADDPENTRKIAVTAQDWYKAAFSTLPGDAQGAEIVSESTTRVKAIYKPDPEKGRYTLKAKDAVIGASFTFLKSKQLVIDDDSDDEFIFGDDDMPGC